MRLVSPSEHQLLIFWAQLLVLLVVARGLGQVMRRIGQPAIVGELAAGVVLGPSILGRVAPDVFDWLFPVDRVQAGMLTAVGWVGILLLMVVTGLETDLALIRRLGRPAALVSASSLVVPMGAGLVVGAVMPAVFIGEEHGRLEFVLFIGVALSISSLAVVGKILAELGLLRRNLGQVTLAAGMSNDMVGWILLGIISAVATAGEVALGPVAVTVLGMAAFLVAALTVGQRAVDTSLRSLRRRDAGITGHVTAMVVFALVAGVVTQWLGVEAVLGAFVAGVVIGRSKARDERSTEVVEAATVGVFAPIFFALAGLRVDLGLLDDSTVLGWGVAVIVVAMVAKFVGVYVSARVARLPGVEAVALGFSLNARGTLEIVIATIGLTLGVFSGEAYTVVMMMAITASMIVPPLLRLTVHRWEGTLEEQERLRREEALAQNRVVRAGRLLLPSRGGPNSIVAAQVMHLTWPEEVEATVISVGTDRQNADLEVLHDLLHERPHRIRNVRGEDAARAILAEAGLGYAAIGIGADAGGDEGELSPLVEEVLSGTPIPVVIVRRSPREDRRLPAAFARALVPASGTPASRAGQEVAFGLSSRIGTEIVLAHVVPLDPADGDAVAAAQNPLSSGMMRLVVPRLRGRHRIAQQVIDEASDLAARMGARIVTTVREGVSTSGELIATAEETEADLVVVGATIKYLADGPFLGHTVEQILADCPTTVVVVATPPA